MSGALRAYNTYSVFVGKIDPYTKKYELRELFQTCGEIMDVVILQNSSTIHNFGFVRFADVNAAYKAVSELNGWNLKGSRLTVDISKDTAEKIKQGILEKSGKPVTVIDGLGPKFNKHDNKSHGESIKPRGTTYVTDTMYRSRLEESCSALNMKHCNTGRLRMNVIQQDMDAMKGSRCPTLWERIDKPVGSFAEISHKIMESCKSQCKDGAMLGKKNAAEFMSALTTIMSEFDNVFDEIRQTCNKKESELSGQLKLDQDLIKEIKEELNSSSEEEMFKLTKLNSESWSELHRKRNARSKPESKSDASVQTNTMELEKSEQGKHVKRSVDNNSDSDLTDVDTGTAQRYFTAVGSSDSENDTSYIDPAIIDYHLSKMSEGEKEECKKNIGEREECNGSIENSDQPDIVKMLFSKMTVGNNSPNELRRLNCGDGKRSPTNCSGMNFVDLKSRKSPTVLENGLSVHSNNEDSGSFSDNGIRSKGRRSEGQVANFQGIEDGGQIVNGAEGNQNKHLHGSVSEPSLGTFDIQHYVLMSKGRGRGMFADRSTKGSVQTSTGHNGFTGVGRGQLQTGIGRGQLHSWKRN